MMATISSYNYGAAAATAPSGDWPAAAGDWSDPRAARLGKRYTLFVAATWLAGLGLGFTTSLSILVVVGFLCAITGVFRPAIGLLGVTTLCTLDSVTRVYLMTGGLLRWNTFNYWLLIVMLIGLPLLWRRTDPHSRLMRWLLIVLFIWLPFSPDLKSGVLHILNGIIFFGLLVYFHRARHDPELWYWAAVLNGVVAVGGGCLCYLQMSEIKYIDANALVHFSLAALFMLAMAFRLSQANPRRRSILSLLAAANYAMVLLTSSRGGAFTATCCCLYMVWEIRGLSTRVIVVASAAVVVLAILSQFPDMRDKTIGRFTKLFDTRYTVSQRTSGRSALTAAGWNIFLANPMGVGTGGFRKGWADYSSFNSEAGFKKYRGEHVASHNTWLKMLAENGLPGGVFFAAFIVSFTYVGWRSQTPELFRLGLFASVALAVAFSITEFQSKGLWLLASGMTVLLHDGPLRLRQTSDAAGDDLDDGAVQ